VGPPVYPLLAIKQGYQFWASGTQCFRHCSGKRQWWIPPVQNRWLKKQGYERGNSPTCFRHWVGRCPLHTGVLLGRSGMKLSSGLASLIYESAEANVPSSEGKLHLLQCTGLPLRLSRHQGVTKCCPKPLGREPEPRSLLTSGLSRLGTWLAESLRMSSPGTIRAECLRSQVSATKEREGGNVPGTNAIPVLQNQDRSLSQLTRDPLHPWVPLRSTTYLRRRLQQESVALHS